MKNQMAILVGEILPVEEEKQVPVQDAKKSHKRTAKQVYENGASDDYKARSQKRINDRCVV